MLRLPIMSPPNAPAISASTMAAATIGRRRVVFATGVVVDVEVAMGVIAECLELSLKLKLELELSLELSPGAAVICVPDSVTSIIGREDDWRSRCRRLRLPRISAALW